MNNSRGSNARAMREYNERVLLQALRVHGPLPKVQIAKLTGLTPQTVAIIIGRLQADRLVKRETPLRGRVGQPSVPIALNADGAFSIGIKIGRQSLDTLLIDFTGRVRARFSFEYRYPKPKQIFETIAKHVEQISATLGIRERSRIQGIGVAAPFSLGGWQRLLGMPANLPQQWQRTDIGEKVAGATNLPVEIIKDTAAACVAELVAGRGRQLRSFLYIFVDTFIGGGLVLDGQWHSGLHGNAGAIGSMSLGVTRVRGQQLLGLASLLNLENLFREHGLPTGATHDDRALQPPWKPYSKGWLAQAASGIALTVHNAACLLDLEGIIIDGSFGRELLAELLGAVNQALDAHDWEGVARPVVMPGTIGSDARALGGALLPLYANFAPDQNSFLKIS